MPSEALAEWFGLGFWAFEKRSGGLRFFFSVLKGVFIYTIVKVDAATPKRWRFVRGHDKPRLMGVALSTFHVV